MIFYFTLKQQKTFFKKYFLGCFFLRLKSLLFIIYYYIIYIVSSPIQFMFIKIILYHFFTYLIYFNSYIEQILLMTDFI